MRLPRLVEPTPAELRTLRPASLALWRSLVRCRVRGRFDEAEWFTARLADLARWSSIAYSTAKVALAELRRAGLVATSRCSRARWVRDRETGELTTVNAYEENLYLVIGALRSRSGVDVIAFPSHAWTRWVSGRMTIAYRCRMPRTEWRREWAEVLCSQKKTKRLGRKSSTSVGIDAAICVRAETSKKAADAADLHDDLFARIAGSDDEDEDLDIGPGMVCGGGGIRTTPLGLPNEAPFLPPDQYPRPPPVVMYVSPQLVPEQKARMVIDGYRRAVEEVYGIDWWHYSKGDIKRTKHYAAFVKAGEQLAEHSVPAEHWAIWRLRWYKTLKRYVETPPPVWIAMSAKTVSERAGWFRKDYDLPVPILQPDPIISEQHMRNREASRRWRGLPDDAVFLLAFPQWYVDKRREEIACGATSPHDLWPTKPGSRYGRTS